LARHWHAYLGTQGAGAVNGAQDRVGSGPWQNAKGTVIANNLTELTQRQQQHHQADGAEREGGAGQRPWRTPNMHDILTGSQPDGTTAFAPRDDRTLRQLDKGGQGAAMVGHHDRQGLRDDDASKSWNSSHPTRGAGRRLQSERSQEHRRQRPLLLFCHEIVSRRRAERRGDDWTCRTRSGWRSAL